jgi:RecB family exonuclease
MDESTSPLIQWLAEPCISFLLEPKWLITERLSIGQQFKDRLNLAGTSTINLQSQTIRSIGLALSSSLLAERQLNVVNQSVSRMLVRTAFEDLLGRGQLHYFDRCTSIVSLSKLLERSIMDLRLATVSPNEIAQQTFEVTEKRDDLVKIYTSYLDALKDNRLVDYAACLDAAIDGLRDGVVHLPERLKVLLPERVTLTGLEQQLLESLKQRATVLDRLPAIESEGIPVEHFKVEMNGPSPRLHFVSAVGEVNEVRSTFQRILSNADGGPKALDGCEVVYTDANTYLPLIVEQLSLWMTELNDPSNNPPPIDLLPVTLAEGLPCIYSRPGRALRSWMRWVESDFLQSRAVQMIREGLLNRPVFAETEQSIGYSRLASNLRSIPIGFKAERYLPKITQAIQEARNRLADYLQNGDKQEDLTEEDRPRDFGLSTLLAVQAMIAPMIQLAPQKSDRFDVVINKAKQFLLSSVRADNRLDRLARNQLLDDMDSMLAATRVTPFTTLDVRQWLEDLPIESRILSSGPMPGKIHVVPIALSGFSGRKNFYILGLDDGRFPGKARVDPVLLDREREGISPKLELAVHKQSRSESAFIPTIVRMADRPDCLVVASYSTRGLSDHRQQFPSTAMLDLFRLAQNLPNAQLPELLRHIGVPQSFATLDHDNVISASDAFLSRLLQLDDRTRQKEIVTDQFPHAAWQQLAFEVQEADSLSAYDGFIPAAGAVMDLTLAERVSASRLESYGACPRRYFFQRGLGIYPPDEWTMDSNGWLDAMQVGNLVHALFEEFLRDLTVANKYPVLARDHDLLLNLLQRKINQLVADCPVVNQDAYQKQCSDLEDMCEIFLAAEEEYCTKTGARPWVLEASIGLEGEQNSIIDSPEPVPLKLSDGRKIMLCGRIDRIDRIQTVGSHRYLIWDYKSGTDFGYSQDKPLHQGRKLQPFLYFGMLRHRIESMQQDADAVEAFGYFFPSRKANGKRLQWRRTQLNSGDEVLRQICDAIERGLFPATTEKSDCVFCDYQAVCYDLEAATDQSRRKALEACNMELLSPWRGLREMD